ncbi:hypothetical protein AX17_006416, partial [Amanita inopinata Kibby_2008]
LEPSRPNTILHRTQSPPPPIELEGELEYEIAEILDSKIDNQRCACKLVYLVRWAGYEGTNEETSWMLTTELDHAQDAVSDFHECYPAKAGPLPL